jgi:hypothetical protein
VKKTKKKSTIGTTYKQLFFTYLIVTKAMYWMGVFAELDGIGEFGRMFVNRMISQDIMVILMLVMMHFLEKKLYPNDSAGNDVKSNAILLGVGWVFFLGILSGYLLILGLFADVSIASWPRMLMEFSLGYAVIGAVIYLKESMKKKQAESYLTGGDSHEGQRFMLETLCKNGVLSQEECDEKLRQIMPNLKGDAE